MEAAMTFDTAWYVEPAGGRGAYVEPAGGQPRMPSALFGLKAEAETPLPVCRRGAH
jgi:hypothetical protein